MYFEEAYDDTSSSVGLSARYGDLIALQQFVQNGVPTNGTDNRGWRPLHEAVAHGHIDCVRILLLANDVEVDALTHEGQTALLLACQADNDLTDIVRLLLSSGADPNMKMGDNWKLPLTAAVNSNNLTIVEQLIQAGADVNNGDCADGPPLHCAAELSLLSIMTVLLDHGAEVHQKDDRYFTALHAVIASKNEQCLLTLIDRGAPVNAMLEDGATPLILACQSNWSKGAMILLDKGADPNLERADHVMALHLAINCISNGSEDADSIGVLMKRLFEVTDLKLMVPLSAHDWQTYHSPYHLAIAQDNFRAIRLLVDFDLPADNCLQWHGAQIVDEENCHLLRQTSLLLNLPGVKVYTPLGYLLSKPLTIDRFNAAKLLIENGSSVNALRSQCLPPLIAAVKHQRASYGFGSVGHQAIELLLKNGANILHKVNTQVVIPSALYVSSLFNVEAYFRLLQDCNVESIYTRQSFERLSEDYANEHLYTVHKTFPSRVVSWLKTVNYFIPQLPKNVVALFNQLRLVSDGNLATAWTTLEKLLETPKTLQELSVLAVRRRVGETRGWQTLTWSLPNLRYFGECLPPIISDLLSFRQINSSQLHMSSSPSDMISSLSHETSSDSSESEDDVFNLTDDDDDDVESIESIEEQEQVEDQQAV